MGQELGVIDLHNANERPDSRSLILLRIIPALPGNPRARAEAQRFPGLQQDQNPLGSACSLQHPHLEQSMSLEVFPLSVQAFLQSVLSAQQRFQRGLAAIHAGSAPAVLIREATGEAHSEQ